MSKKLHVVMETTEVAGVTLCFKSLLVLHEDGTVSGGGTLVADGGHVAFAATGTYVEAVPVAARKVGAG